VRTIVGVVRRARPAVIAVPFADDRHPDHRQAAALLASAIFKAGLRRYADGDAWHAQWVCAYFINDSAPPSFVVDVSDVYDLKRRALTCHASQFRPAAPDAADTRLTSPLFLQLVETRDAQFGAKSRRTLRRGVHGPRAGRAPLLTDRWPGAAPRP